MTLIKNCLWERTSTIPKRNSLERKKLGWTQTQHKGSRWGWGSLVWCSVEDRCSRVNGNHRAIRFEPMGGTSLRLVWGHLQMSICAERLNIHRTKQDSTWKTTLGDFGNKSSRELIPFSSSYWMHPKVVVSSKLRVVLPGFKAYLSHLVGNLGQVIPCVSFSSSEKWG